MSFAKRAIRTLGLFSCLALAGCGAIPGQVLPRLNEPSVVAPVTPGQRDLIYLPPPPSTIPVAVYAFTDQTGQLKVSESGANYSRAVTQGGTSILIGALRSAGNGNWFNVIERERLDNLLRERQIIREMRRQYLGEEETPAEVLPLCCSPASSSKVASSASTPICNRVGSVPASLALAALLNIAPTRRRSTCAR
jgi:curli production assembly/transport component CsgG